MVFTRIRPQKDGFSLLSLSPRLALMYRVLKKPGKNGRRDRIQCAYFGFDTEESALIFAAHVKQKFGAFVQARECDRLVECSYEVKVRDFEGLLEFAVKCHTQAEVKAAAAAEQAALEAERLAEEATTAQDERIAAEMEAAIAA